jgi:hypothetical protein
MHCFSNVINSLKQMIDCVLQIDGNWCADGFCPPVPPEPSRVRLALPRRHAKLHKFAYMGSEERRDHMVSFAPNLLDRNKRQVEIAKRARWNLCDPRHGVAEWTGVP